MHRYGFLLRPFAALEIELLVSPGVLSEAGRLSCAQIDSPKGRSGGSYAR